MDAYAWYVYGAYGCMMIFLISQWFFPWRRLQQLREKNHEQDS